jgi:HEPN domain-containing protein
MPPPPQVVQQWFEKARSDLHAAAALRGDQTLSSQVCFHCQQAVEKSLKAYLVFHDVKFDWSHDLDYLLDLCTVLDAAFDRFRDMAERLTVFAVGMRYPSSQPDPSSSEARESLGWRRGDFRIRPPARSAPKSPGHINPADHFDLWHRRASIPQPARQTNPSIPGSGTSLVLAGLAMIASVVTPGVLN